MTRLAKVEFLLGILTGIAIGMLILELIQRSTWLGV
jgi:hypothetical protein